MLAGAQWTLDASRGFQWSSDDKLCLKKAKFCERQSRAELALRLSMWRLVSTARIDHGSCKDPSWHLVASMSLQERWNSSSTATFDFGLSRMTGQQHMAKSPLVHVETGLHMVKWLICSGLIKDARRCTVDS